MLPVILSGPTVVFRKSDTTVLRTEKYCQIFWRAVVASPVGKGGQGSLLWTKFGLGLGTPSPYFAVGNRKKKGFGSI